MKKFRKTIITIEVLSDGPFEFDSLNSIDHSIMSGDCSGLISSIVEEKLTRDEMIQECDRHLTDPEFFGIAEDELEEFNESIL